MNKKDGLLILLIFLIALLITLCVLMFIINNNSKKSLMVYENINQSNNEIKTEVQTTIQSSKGITVVPTMNDKIVADSSWCGTFQLVWNDMKNEVVKKDIEFRPQLDIVANLNKADFDESMISKNYYYKVYGLKSLSLKEQIENGIKEKFNQTSDILGDFDWTSDGLDNPNNKDVRRYFFYTMLYRKFEFLNEFDKLENDKFGDKYKDIEYFGIDGNTENLVGDQITVLYYNSKDDFAILINTKTNDEVIFCKNPKGNSFNEIYENMNNEASNYTGNKSFEKIDEFKAPKLTFNEKKEYTELENKLFKTADPVYDTAEIEKAIQTIEFTLDEKGGEIKSEAAIDMAVMATAVTPITKKEEPRYFYVDDTFAIFLREKGKDKPYFAGRIDDITKFQ